MSWGPQAHQTGIERLPRRHFASDIVLHFSEDCDPWFDEPDRFLYDIDGVIGLRQKSDDSPPITVGEFEAIYVDVASACNDRQSLWEVFDARSQETADYYPVLFDDDDLKPTVIKAARLDEATWNLNVLLLTRLVIRPEYRGFGMGLVALHCAISRLQRGVGLIAMNPHPLQYGARSIQEDRRQELRLEEFTDTLRVSRTKLQQHYGRLGFRRVPGTNYMVRSAEIPLPSLESLASSRT